MINFLRKYWFFVLLFIIFVTLFLSFPIHAAIDIVDVITEGAYFLGLLIGFIIIRRLKVAVLNIGWEIFVIGFLIDFLDELSQQPYFINTILEGMITTTGVVLIAFGIYKVVTRHEKTEEEIRYLSFYDPLTGLYNRRYFENEMKRLNYSRDLPIGIVMADVDGFKSVNDTFGHKEGDRLLQDTAKTLRSVTRKGDILTRIGSMSRGR